jgi:hypothetical protein
MNLAETIYQKSNVLSEQQAVEVIHFIDFLKTRSHLADKPQKEREQAIAHLKKTSLNWGEKPILNRDELHDNARN